MLAVLIMSWLWNWRYTDSIYCAYSQCSKSLCKCIWTPTILWYFMTKIYTKMKLLKPLCWTRQVRVPHLSPAALQSTNSADTFAFKRGMIAAVGPSFNRCFESQDFPFWKGRFCSELSHPKLPGPCVASRENTQSDFGLHEWLADSSSNPPQLSLCETTNGCVFLPEKTVWVCASRWAELCKSCKQKCLMWLWNMSPRFDALAASFLLEVSQVPET